MGLEEDAAIARQLQATLDRESTRGTSEAAQENGAKPAMTSPLEDADADLARRLHQEWSKSDAMNRPDSGGVESEPTVMEAQEVQESVRSFAQPIIKAKCEKCRQMLFKEADILAYARNLLEHADGTKLNCLSCGTQTAHPHSRATLIWIVLCFFDSMSKHNQAQKKSKKVGWVDTELGRAEGSWGGHHNGTGYGGVREKAHKAPKMPKTTKELKMPSTAPNLDTTQPAGFESEYTHTDDDDDYEDYIKEFLAKQAAEPAVDAFAAHGQPRSSEPRPLNEDDSMTQKAMHCLIKLLPSVERVEACDFDPPRKQIQSLLLCSSILERTADLLRNNHLDDVINQAALYMSLIQFLEILAKHPSTSPLVFGERIIRSPAANILQISLGEAELASEAADTTFPLTKWASELASVADVMLKTPDANADDVRLFRSITDLHGFMAANAGFVKKTSKLEKNHWHKEFAISEVPDHFIIDRYGLITGTPQETRPTGQMKRIMQELGQLKTGLPPGIFVRYCETRPGIMKILIIGPKDTPYENGLFEFDLLCDASFPWLPPKMDFRTTGGGVVNFNPNLYQCGQVCLSLLGTWPGEPWDPKQSTLLQIVVSIQAMIFCEHPWQNEPGHEYSSYSGAVDGSKAYNRSLYPHTIQTAMLDWLGQKSFSIAPHGLDNPDGLGEEKIEPKIDTQNIWTEIVKRHFDDNAKDIMETVRNWVKEGISTPASRPEKAEFAKKGTITGDEVESAMTGPHLPSNAPPPLPSSSTKHFAPMFSAPGFPTGILSKSYAAYQAKLNANQQATSQNQSHPPPHFPVDQTVSETMFVSQKVIGLVPSGSPLGTRNQGKVLGGEDLVKMLKEAVVELKKKREEKE